LLNKIEKGVKGDSEDRGLLKRRRQIEPRFKKMKKDKAAKPTTKPTTATRRSGRNKEM